MSTTPEDSMTDEAHRGEEGSRKSDNGDESILVLTGDRDSEDTLSAEELPLDKQYTEKQEKSNKEIGMENDKNKEETDLQARRELRRQDSLDDKDIVKDEEGRKRLEEKATSQEKAEGSAVLKGPPMYTATLEVGQVVIAPFSPGMMVSHSTPVRKNVESCKTDDKLDEELKRDSYKTDEKLDEELKRDSYKTEEKLGEEMKRDSYKTDEKLDEELKGDSNKTDEKLDEELKRDSCKTDEKTCEKKIEKLKEDSYKTDQKIDEKLKEDKPEELQETDDDETVQRFDTVDDVHDNYYNHAHKNKTNVYNQQEEAENESYESEEEEEHISSVSENGDDETTRKRIFLNVDDDFIDEDYQLSIGIFPSLSTPDIFTQYEEPQAMGQSRSEELLSAYNDDTGSSTRHKFYSRYQSPNSPKISKFKFEAPKFSTKASSFRYQTQPRKSKLPHKLRWSISDLRPSSPFNEYTSDLYTTVKVSKHFLLSFVNFAVNLSPGTKRSSTAPSLPNLNLHVLQVRQMLMS